MKLESVFSILCPRVQANTDIKQLYNLASLHDKDSHRIVYVSFEYSFHSPKKGIHKTGSQVKTVSSQNTHSISANNPIYDILHRSQILENQDNRKPSTDVKASIKCTDAQHITQRVWNMKAIAPLIVWLQKKNVRYTHSDWVSHYTNGERECTFTQHGVIVQKAHVQHRSEYLCKGGFHNIQLRCSVKHQKQIMDSEDEIWSSFLNKKSNIVFCNKHQQRIYAWDSYTSLILNTTDGKQYNVCVEHNISLADHQSTLRFRLLLSILSYHFSQHTRSQIRV